MSDTIEHWHHDHCSGLEPILKGGANFTNLKKRILEECGYRNANDPVAHLLYDCLIALSDSPSVNPEIYEWCTDCKEYDQEKHCCPRWNKVIKKTIDEMKPKIVHCGECRHYVFVDDRMDMFPIRGCSVTGFRDVDAGDFCSRAERREDG